MSEAMVLYPIGEQDRTIQALSVKIGQAIENGVQYTTIEKESGVKRGQISVLVNHVKECILSEERQSWLWAWADRYEARRQAQTQALMSGQYKKELTIIPTASYSEAIGLCKLAQAQHLFLTLTGMPGVGKTTIVQELKRVLTRAICIEAWPMMRMGDLLDDIAAGIGIKLTGSQTNKARQIERALAGSDVTLVIDEAEMLHKWDNDKLEVLRKIWDHTGISMIWMGTPRLLEVVNRMDTTQLSRRMICRPVLGATAQEVRAELAGFDIDDDAADALAQIAADTEHGGMGSYTMMMRMCMEFAKGERITKALFDATRKYKPGLRGCV